MNAAPHLAVVKPPPKWRTLLILGRISNLPTVWSNVLAGWWLGGGGRRGGLLVALAATTFLYIGGMFLNDAFDADFDRRHRALRPIPSGAIAEKEVWRWGAFWLALGAAALLGLGLKSAVLALALIGFIVLYDATHKSISFGPLLMGICRLLLYLIAAAAGGGALTGRVIWPAAALALYVAGLSWLARTESGTARPPIWPVALLAAPFALAALVSAPKVWPSTAWFALATALWIGWALAQTFGRAYPRVGLTIARLLAGMALVDMLAAGQADRGWLWGFPAFFLLALFLQRFIPAT
ncbi:MAG TPA: UbiA family prenyltransferase [Verrucomicrobiae bacterium]|nr:UbiA family prenyltransferase [Verrucomicrobiae bacterium]